VGDLHYNPWSDNTYGGMVSRKWSSLASKFGKKKKETVEDQSTKRADDVHIQIYKRSDNK